MSGINETATVTLNVVANTSVRSVFHIKGKHYLCEKITATFTEYGMSQLLKGEFYPLLDD